MKKIKLFLLPALVLAMVASLTAGIVAANFGTKAKVNAEGTITVYAQLDANAEQYKEYVKINCNDGGDWWALVDMTYDDVAEMYKAEIDAKTTRVQLSFKSDWWTSFVESGVADNSIIGVNGNDLSLTGTYEEPAEPEPVFIPDADTYYLVGEFDGANCWAITETSTASVARTGDNGAFYNVTLNAGDAFKSQKGDGVWAQWNQDNEGNKALLTFDGSANGVVKADGEYNIYVNTSNELYIVKVSFDLDARNVDSGLTFSSETLIPGTIYTAVATESKKIEMNACNTYIGDEHFEIRFKFAGSANALKFVAPEDGAIDAIVYNKGKTASIKQGSTTVASVVIGDSGIETLRGAVEAGKEYTLSGAGGGISVYAIYFRDEAYLAAEAKAATIADGIAEMAKNPGWYVVGKINGGTGDDEIDFAFSTYRGITMATGDNTAEYWGIELTAGDKIKFAYCDGEGHVTYTAGDNAEIAEDGTYNVYCYTGNDSQKYTSAAKVVREDFGIEKLISKTSIDNQYILFVAGITLDKEAAYEGYYIGMCINGTSYGGQKYYTSISLKTGYDEDKQEDIRVIKTVDELFEDSNAMIVTEIDFAEINEVVVYVYNGTTIVDSVRYSK